MYGSAITGNDGASPAAGSFPPASSLGHEKILIEPSFINILPLWQKEESMD
jgi:hypothetical protein